MRIIPSVFAAILASATALAPQLAAADQVVIFLHNAWLEKHKNGEAHPRFGAYDFAGIKTALSAGGRLIAPERGPGADPEAAAEGVVSEIRAMIESGVSPGNIKVIGASKGAYIAQLASARLGNPELRWVLVAGCHVRRMENAANPLMTGHVFSLYDQSDTAATDCARYVGMYSRTASFRELALATGRDHGFQFSADQAWIAPALSF